MGRNARLKGVLSAPFGLSLFVFAVTPNAIGTQDVASALAARQPAAGAHWRQHFRASAFGTIHAATFSFSRPIGTAMPQPLSYQLASLDPRMLMPAPWDDAAADEDDEPQLQFPTVDRSAKGDRQPVSVPAAAATGKADKAKPAAVESPVPVAAQEDAPAETAAAPTDVAATELDQPPSAAVEDQPSAAREEQTAVASESEPKPEEQTESETKPADTEAAENPPVDIPDPVDTVVAEATDFTFPEPAEAAEPLEPTLEMARLYFGNEPLGDAPGSIEKWAPGEEPVIVTPAAPADREIKQAALDPRQMPEDTKGGESIAPKGEVTGEGKRPLTPAERLSLEGKDRTKAEKCLADAVYFEARGEPVRGQIAVAQVVMNRVFSGFYPRNVCATVYQNKHRRLACQFTFACDGIPDTVTEPHAWVRATRIARDVLDGKYWVPEVNRATHYHAYWVRPRWVREMKRLYKFGVHSFYRPRRWGDGSEMPSWGTTEATTEAIAKL